MPKETIFISSVHKKFANERQALAAYIREDELLKLYFEENRSNLVTLWCSSSGTDHVTDYDTVLVTVQDTGQVTVQVGHINYLSEPERVLLILEGEMSREDLMTLLELKHRDNFMDKYLKPAIAQG